MKTEEVDILTSFSLFDAKCNTLDKWNLKKIFYKLNALIKWYKNENIASM